VKRRWTWDVTTIRGPWMSLGIHINVQAPLIDLHVVWWVLSIGRLYHKQGL
jgi:hypothetical protein